MFHRTGHDRIEKENLISSEPVSFVPDETQGGSVRPVISALRRNLPSVDEYEEAVSRRYRQWTRKGQEAPPPPANESASLTNETFYVYESSTPGKEKDIPVMSTEDNKVENKSETTASSRIDIPGGVFTRPGQPPIAGRVPGAYPGAYPAAAPYAQSVVQSTNDAAGRKLYIGRGITLSGEIESCDHLVVEGTVEAALKGASVLEIAEAGAFFGTVEIEEATIAGRFEGDLTVKGRLTIKSTGSITGEISYKELAVEAGAILDGKVNPIDAKSAGSMGSARKVVGVSRKSSDFGAELPFEGKAVAAE